MPKMHWQLPIPHPLGASILVLPMEAWCPSAALELATVLNWHRLWRYTLRQYRNVYIIIIIIVK